MEIGIVGLSKSGKTTVFNALTRGKAETMAYSTTTTEPNIGVAKVQDPRLLRLEEMLKPKRTIPAEVKYVDMAIPRGLGKGEGLSSQFLTHLSKVDALIYIVRAFQDERVPHIEGSIDPERDIATINLELTFSDLTIIERRLKRIEDSLKGARSPERETLHREQTLMARIKAALENEVAVREQSLNEEEAKTIANYQFLTAKPMMVGLNIGEEQLPQASSLEAEIRLSSPQFQIAALCGKLEMELTQLPDAEAEEFRSALGIKERAIDRFIKLSYELLGLISFFTTASGEMKAWTIHRNTPASKAAGKIHSDMERGFIRAEVITYDELIRCGSLAKARKQGSLRLEGKNYIVQDGDVINFLFSV
jgi:hypothetical protein